MSDIYLAPHEHIKEIDSNLPEYELSVWRDVADEQNYLTEEKIATIGDRTLKAPTKAFDITLKETINGEKTLTFKILRKYYDDSGNLIDNPFIKLLVTEAKLKLREGKAYNLYSNGDIINGRYMSEIAKEEDIENKWTDFLIKECTEDKKSYINTYTCKELYTTELGKNGWSVVLDSELKNNYGNLTQLAERILEGSGWTVASTLNPSEHIIEPLFYFKNTRIIKGKNVISGEERIIPANSIIYTFYSEVEYINGNWRLKSTKPQILWKSDVPFTIDADCDDGLVILDDNDEYNINVTSGISSTNQYSLIIVGGEEESKLEEEERSGSDGAIQGRKIIKSYSSHFETVGDNYVYDYTVSKEGTGLDIGSLVYGYQETKYLTSESVQNKLVNASDFTGYLGWQGTKDPEYIYFPQKTPTQSVESWKPINYLVIPTSEKNKRECYYNNGIAANEMNLIKGEKYVIRLKARRVKNDAKYPYVYDNKAKKITSYNIDYGQNKMKYGKSAGLWVSVVKNYAGGNTPNAGNDMSGNSDYSLWDKRWGYCVSFTPDKTALGTAKINAYTDFGFPIKLTTRNNRASTANVWHRDEQGYYYLIYTAKRSTNAATDNTSLVFTQGNPNGAYSGWHWEVQDVQFFEYKEEEINGRKIPIFPGDLPNSQIDTVNHFYYINNSGKVVELPRNTSYYKKVESTTAIRHLDVKESNYFNNINNLAELFGVWVSFRPVHTKDGRQFKEKDGTPRKEVIFSKFAPFDEPNWAGFKYGVNLDNIQRKTVSSAIATKVIVKDNYNEFAQNGICSITRAVDNPSGERHLYNFDYFIRQGLIDAQQLQKDLYSQKEGLQYYKTMKNLNNSLSSHNKKIVDNTSALISAQDYYNSYHAARDEYYAKYQQARTLYNMAKGQEKVSEDKLKDYEVAYAQAKAKYDKWVETEKKWKEKVDNYNNILYKGKINNKASKTYQHFWNGGTAYEKGDIVRTEDNKYYIALKSNMNRKVTNTNYWKQRSNTNNALYNQLSLYDQAEWQKDRKKILEDKFYNKYARFIQEGTWTDEKYIDDDLYFYDAMKISRQSAFPKVEYTINVVDIGGIKKWAGYTFKIGQRTYVEDTDFFGYVYNQSNGVKRNEYVRTPYKKEVIISERTRNFDDPSKSTITVKSYRNQWEDLFSKITATTASLQYAAGSFSKAANVVNNDRSIDMSSIQKTFLNGDSYSLSISGTDSVKLDNRGLTVNDPANPAAVVRIDSAGVKVSSDGGKNYATAINGAGITTELLKAGQIDADKINILNASKGLAFTWDSQGLNAYLARANDFSKGRNGQVYVRFSELGLFGTNKGDDIERILAVDENKDTLTKIEDIKDYTKFFLTWDGLYLNGDNGGVTLRPDEGLEIFSNGWTWKNSILSSDYPYITKATATTTQPIVYQVGEKIPIITLGNYTYKNGEDIIHDYGMVMRNSEGYITLMTSSKGNLLLNNHLQVGQNFSYLDNEKTEYAFAKRSHDEDKNKDILSLDLEGVLKNGIIRIKNGQQTYSFLYTNNTASTNYLDEETGIIVLDVSKYDDLTSGLYEVSYPVEIRRYRSLGINGNIKDLQNERTIKKTLTGIVKKENNYFTITFDDTFDTKLGYVYNDNIKINLNNRNVIQKNNKTIISSALISTVNGNGTNLYSAPSINAALAMSGKIPVNNEFYIFDYKDDYYFIEYNGIQGWVSKNDLGEVEQEISSNNLENGSSIFTVVNNVVKDPVVLYAGLYVDENSANADAEMEQAPFRIYADGRFVASNADVSGTINAKYGRFSGLIEVGDSGTAGINGSANADYVFWSGDDQDNPRFSVDQSGILRAVGGQFTEGEFNNINVVNGKFSGNIEANSGNINQLMFLGYDQDKQAGEFNSFIGAGTDESAITQNSVVLNISNYNFLVKANGEYFGQLAALGYVEPENVEKETEDDNARTSISNYAIVLGEYDYGPETHSMFNIFAPGKGENEETIVQGTSVFSVDKIGQVHIAGTLNADNGLRLRGRLLVGDKNDNELTPNNSIIIDGENGSIYGGDAWSIDKDGTGRFENVEVRGSIKTSIFEYDKVSAIGGTLAVTPSYYILNEIQGIQVSETNYYKFPVDLTNADLWNNNDKILVIFNSGQENNKQEIHTIGKIVWESEKAYLELISTNDDIKTQIANDFNVTKNQITDGMGISILPAGTSLINTDVRHNSVVLNAMHKNGSTVMMTGPRGSEGQHSTTLIGYLNPEKISQTILGSEEYRYLDTELADAKYGLFADNAYILGKILLPNAGITDGNSNDNKITNKAILNDLDQDINIWKSYVQDEQVDGENNIRIWAGASPNNRRIAPFIVTQSGRLYARDGIFTGQILAKNSIFEGAIRASGINLVSSQGNWTKYDHFPIYVSNDLEAEVPQANVSSYIADFNRYGLNLWEGGLHIFSDYYNNGGTHPIEGISNNDIKTIVTEDNVDVLKTKFDNYKIDSSQILEKYYPGSHRPFPIFTTRDTQSISEEIAEDDNKVGEFYPRAIASNLQVFLGVNYGSDNQEEYWATRLTSRNIKFTRTIQSMDKGTGNKFDFIADTLWNSSSSTESIPLNIGFKQNGSNQIIGLGVSTEYAPNGLEIWDGDADNSEAGIAVSIQPHSATSNGVGNNSKIQIHGQTEYENIRIEQLEDGLAYFYTGE